MFNERRERSLPSVGIELVEQFDVDIPDILDRISRHRGSSRKRIRVQGDEETRETAFLAPMSERKSCRIRCGCYQRSLLPAKLLILIKLGNVSDARRRRSLRASFACSRASRLRPRLCSQNWRDSGTLPHLRRSNICPPLPGINICLNESFVVVALHVFVYPRELHSARNGRHIISIHAIPLHATSDADCAMRRTSGRMNTVIRCFFAAVLFRYAFRLYMQRASCRGA